MTNVIIADIEALLAKAKAAFTPAVQTIETDAVTLEQWVVTNGYPLIMQDALALITGALTGTPWATLTASLISQAEAQGKTLEAGAAQVALNLAQSQLIVAGTVAPVTPTASIVPPAA